MTAIAAPIPDAVDVALQDGSSVHLRPIVADDRDRMRAFMASLSPESMLFRFFGMPSLDWSADWSVNVDYSDRHGIVAELGPERTIVAHAAYIRAGRDRAEVALVVADSLQGHGIGTLMLAQLAMVARRHGIETFAADVMSTNHRMLSVFRDSGFPSEHHITDGVVKVEFPTAASEQTLEAFERRAQHAASNAVRCFLAPSSLAVIGASRRPGSVGAELLRNVIDGGFSGPVCPVNRSGVTIGGLPAYRSILEVPEPVELAIVAVPAAEVAAVATACADAGVRALLVISAGFGELGGEGTERQTELLDICRRAGMRLIGPNCLGVINTDPAVGLDATFAAHQPVAGNVGFSSQSGGLGIALIEASERLGIGLSSFVSVGNKADISGNDLLEYWEDDSATDVILLYLESFGNPRRFARIARRVSRTKPILAVKSGRTPAGARATSSHTGALLSASDVTVDALFRQAGVIRADTIGELLDTATVLSTQPPPRGRRVGIITNGGGPGILCADACEAAGLEVVELPAQTRDELASILPDGASVINPVDMIATATAEQFRQSIEILTRSGACDAIVSLFVPPLMTEAADVARELDRAAASAGDVTLTSVFMDHQLPPGRGSVPRFQFPEDAVRALAHAVRYGEWRARPVGTVPVPEACRTEDAAKLIARELEAGGGWLGPAEVAELLDCYGLPLIPTRVVSSEREAVAAAAALGLPVAMKAYGPGLVHKSESGAVRLGLKDADSVASATREMRRAVKQAGHSVAGFVVQPMIAGGVELLLGVVHDESFGPVIACGAGGTTAELLRDVSVRITPLTDFDAREMLGALRVFPLLTGYRGSPACDLDAITDVLLRLSALVEAHPEVAELDANPLIAQPSGAAIVDARIRLGQPASKAPAGEFGELRGASALPARPTNAACTPRAPDVER